MTEARLCVLCVTRGRQPQHYDYPQACEPCRVWLARLPGDIVTLWARLGEHHLVEPDSPWKVQQLYKGHWVRQNGNDPVAAALPTGANGARIGHDIVTGSRDPQVPVNLDLVDLTLPVHGDHLTDIGRLWWMDQTGHISVAQELDLLVREWADELGHRLPAPTVPVLAGWLTDRMPWACDHHPGVDHAAGQLHRLRGVLRGVLGETEQRPEHMGAPCPGCDRITLIRQPGEDKVECAHEDCMRILTAEEYERWGGMTLTDRAEGAAA